MKELDLSLSKVPKFASIWLLGDFNIHSADWNNNTVRHGGSHTAVSKLMLDIAADFNLTQVVNPDLVINYQVIAGISDHDIVVVDMKLAAKLIKPPKRKVFLYKKAEFNEISELINEFDRSLTEEHLQASDVNCLWDNFQTTLQAAIDKYVPSKLSSTRYNSPWIDQSIRRDIRRKQRLFNKARKSGSSKVGKTLNHYVD